MQQNSCIIRQVLFLGALHLASTHHKMSSPPRHVIPHLSRRTSIRTALDHTQSEFSLHLFLKLDLFLGCWCKTLT